MVEVHAVWLVPEYGIGQRGLKIGAMNLMIIRTKSFDIVGSVCPGFYDHTGLEMAYQVADALPGAYVGLWCFESTDKASRLSFYSYGGIWRGSPTR